MTYSNCNKCGSIRIFSCPAEMKRRNKTGMCNDCYRKNTITPSGKDNPNYKGENVTSYTGLHVWIKRNLVKPQTCRDCNQVKPLDLANISQEYRHDFSDWEWLCRSCHMKKDGRLKRLQEQHALKVKGFIPWNRDIPMRPEVKAKMLATKRERGQIK